jgi:hypothetical protein
MRVRTDVLLILLLALAVGLGVLLNTIGARPNREPQDTRTSTFVTNPDGSQAIYETLAELGVPVKRRRTALFSLADERTPTAVLAVIAPRDELLPEELAEVVRYVAQGGTVVAAGEGGGITACAGFESPRADSGWVSDGRFGRSGRQYRVHARSGYDLPATRRVLVPWKPPEDFPRAALRYRRMAGCDSLAVATADTLVATLDGRAVALDLRYARHAGGLAGRMILVAEPSYFRNRAWRETEVAYLLVPLLVPRQRGAVVWDEYHQGFEQGSGTNAAIADWLRRSPAGWALLQIGAVVLVALAVRAVRFGPALAVVERRRRSPLEHVDALAAGLEGAGGAATAVDLVVSGLRRRLSRTGQPLTGDVAPWLSTLELALPTPRGRAAARELQRLRREPGGPERLLAAAQAVEDVWQDLRPRSNPAAS